jgi:hypothetical protein
VVGRPNELKVAALWAGLDEPHPLESANEFTATDSRDIIWRRIGTHDIFRDAQNRP